MNVDNFDLNLIRVFLAIAKSGQVTEAGKQLGLTQSSVSHALARLRALCNDPLFVRTNEGMMPTVVAQAMIEPMEQGLAMVRSSLRGSAVFDPTQSDRCFNLLLSDLGQLVYLPPLVAHLRVHAPRVRIDVLHLSIGAYQDALTSGTADLAIGHHPSLQAGFRQRSLFQTPYVCMLRADHPQIQGSISLKQYLGATHIVVEPPGRGPGVVEQALSKARLRRQIVMRLPHFFAGPLIVQRSDHLMTVPLRTHLLDQTMENIAILPLPFEVELMHIKQLWHERLHHDPGHRWLRGVISELFSDASGEPEASVKELSG